MTVIQGSECNLMQQEADQDQTLNDSFVDSIFDEETDELLEYQLIWEGGDLGIALTTLEEGASSANPGLGVAVSRVTGKGFPFGIKNVSSGDILLFINTEDITKLTLQQAVAYLQECDLPATLRFKKNKEKATVAPPVPRSSNVVITGSQMEPSSTDTRPKSNSRGSRGFKALGKQRTSIFSQLSVTDSARNTLASQTTSFDGGAPQSFLLDSRIITAKTMKTQPEKKMSEDALNQAEAERMAAADEFDAFFNQEDSESDSEGNQIENEDNAGQSADSEDDDDSIDEYRAKALQATERKGGDDDSISIAMLDSRSVGMSSTAMMKAPSISEASNLDKIKPSFKYSLDFHDEDEENDDHVDNDNIGSFSGDAIISEIAQVSEPQRSTDIHVPNPSDISEDSVRPTITENKLIRQSQPVNALQTLCAKGNLRGVVQHLRVKGFAELAEKEPNHGQTGLHLAVKSGNTQVVKLIIEQFKPLEEIINMEDDKGNTALHFAATRTPAMVHLLLEHGAAANVKNSRKLTPLIISVITAKEDSVIIPRVLLKFGANPNDMHDSQTVIHTAIELKRLNIASALVHAGAKLDVEDTEGNNVFEKLNRKALRELISHIYFPPTFISEKERSFCMLCRKKPGFGHRKINCTHCGRFCCFECAALMMEMHKFPLGFPGRIRRGAANRELKRVCKTCYNILKERNAEPAKSGNRFMKRVVGIEWDEINPEKLVKSRAAGRRGGKE